METISPTSWLSGSALDPDWMPHPLCTQQPALVNNHSHDTATIANVLTNQLATMLVIMESCIVTDWSLMVASVMTPDMRAASE